MSTKVFRIVFVLVGVVFAASLAYLLAHSRGGGRPVVVGPQGPAHSADPLVPDEAVVQGGLSIPAFALTTSDGKTIGRDVLNGHLTIVDFFFTRCTFVCPVLTQQLIDQSKALRGTGVRMLCVSVDPDHETNESLSAYAAEHVPKESAPGEWTFARGDKETIGAIVTGGMKFEVGEDPERTIKIEGGKTMQNIVHPRWFTLVGPKGEVLGIYNATEEDEMRALTERVRAGARKMGR